MIVQLKEVLKLKGVSMSELAARSGIAQPNISNIYNGKTMPSIETIARIADALRVPISDLLQSKDVTGFIKYRGVVYEVNNFNDLNAITSKVKAENSL